MEIMAATQTVEPVAAPAEPSDAALPAQPDMPVTQDAAPEELAQESAPQAIEPVESDVVASAPAPTPTPTESHQVESLLVGLTTAARSAGPSLSALTLSTLDDTPLPAAEPSTNSVVDSLVNKLIEEARSRADLAVGAYEKLSDEVRQNAKGWRKSARRAGALASTMALALLIGGVWSAYRLGRQNAVVQGLEQQVAQGQAVASDRDELRIELTAAHTEQAQESMQLRVEQAEMLKTRSELKLCQDKLEAAEQARAVQNAAGPATQPAAAATPQPETWAALLGQ